MLTFVVDGFYKTMSSLVYRAIRDTGELILYEPLAPRDNYQVSDYHPLHGFDVWDSYKDPRFAPYFSEYKRVHQVIQKRIGGDNTPVKLRDAREFFNFIHSIPVNVSLQTNNCHFILKELSDEYSADIVYLIRNPLEVWLSFVLGVPADIDRFVREWCEHKLRAKVVYRMLRFLHAHKTNAICNSMIRLLLFKVQPKNPRVKNSYFLERRYRILKRNFELPDISDYLDMFLVVYVLSSYHGYVNAHDSSGVVLYYEDIVRDPKNVVRILRSRGIPVSGKVLDSVNPSYRYVDAKGMGIIEDRIEKLGLWDEYSEFSKW